MKSLLKTVEGLLSTAMKSTLSIEEAASVSVSPHIGDYRCSNAIKLFNQYKKSGAFGCASIKELAEKIIAGIPANPYIHKAEATPTKGTLFISPIPIADDPKSPYFINVYLKNEVLEEELMKILKSGVSYQAPAKQRILVDFSSPNIAKELHVGHLRSTIIGDATCRIFEFLGHEVLRVNHVGDWGTQFGMLTAALFDAYPDFMEKKPNLGELKTFYQNAKERFDKDEEFKKKSHQNVVLLQSGDPKVTAAWKYLCDLSRQEFQRIYDRLDIKIKEVGESFYNPFIPPTIKMLEDKGIVKIDKGAKVIFIPKQKIPLIVQKSDGGYSYDSTDIAAIWYRITQLKCERLIYVTDIGQQLHFNLVFEAAKMAGWHTPPKTRTDHMGFGLVLGEGGKKIKTREGKSEKLMDLLDEATKKAYEQLVIRSKETASISGSTDAELKDSAERIGMASIKYFDLKQNRVSNYAFSYDKMLDPKGDTALYLLYAYARLESILRKAGADQAKLQELIEKSKIVIGHEKERKLAFEIMQFPDVIDGFVEDLYPNKLCALVYDIAVYVGEFYENCKVIGSPEQDSRILLIAASLKMMKCILNLLGIEPLSKIQGKRLIQPILSPHFYTYVLMH
eukprot:TRINITY_DN2920_c0_g1_i1.p2 TRINITY_DN2920_c0_g1~~TRINITY_DN2920_c0_g1_i1.p2  ORF type:complete len:621 (-),score=87.04 TRINITY_DN2920_c0_g1_i1:56-1918(-)